MYRLTSVQQAHFLSVCVGLLIAIHLCNIEAIQLPKPHVDYIQRMITQFMASKGYFSNGVIYPPRCLPSHLIRSVQDLIHEFSLPPIILWNPLTLSNELQIQCNICNEQMYQSSWNDGSLQYNSPRLLHDLKSHVLLVSALYSCKNGHKLLAHDERLLNKISPTTIPFVLLHKSGFTKDFVNFCCSFCQGGMNFHSLEKAIGQVRWQYYEERKQIYTEYAKKIDCIEHDQFHIAPFTEVNSKHLPSDDAICQCFVTSFLSNENMYRAQLQSMPVGECLSLDHTYKVASNIGYLRGDRKWVSQYDGAFIVFNKDGNIVSWQYTKSGSFEQVKPILQALAERGIRQENTIKTVYIDNCCHWRNKIQGVFGPTCKVKLDIFHAVQRVVQKVPKKHPFHSQCAIDLGQVFRDEGDNGMKRTKPTPSSCKIIANLNRFVSRWENVVYNGKQVLSAPALDEIDKLKVHINKGCLSDIPVGCGTNHNEAFHRYIRTFFHRSRVGILVAYALMMVIIYQFNSNEGSSRKKLVKPITSYSSNITPSVSHYEPMGIVNTYTSREDFTWHQENCTDELIDHSSKVQLVQQTVHQYQLMTQMNKHSSMASELWKFIQYSQVIPIFSTITERDVHAQRLQRLLSSWKFTMINVPEDGNCFFTSVALELSNFSKETIQQLGLSLSAPITDLVMKLREVMVDEWIGCRRHLYEEFLSNSSQFESWATSFKQNFFYDCELGNTMPLAMANALHVSFAIFTSHERSPLYYVTPTSSSTDVLYLAYNLHGSGHYNACVPCDDSCVSLVKVIKCRCGVNRRESDKENFIACNNSTNGRHSICKCLAAGQACSSLCKCKDCKNPVGQRTVLGKRKREIHAWQKVNTSNTDFANSREHLAQGSWSKFEDILFVGIINHLNQDMTDISSTCLSDVFNETVDFVNSNYCAIDIPAGIQLRHKSEKQCAGKLAKFQQEKTLFQQIQ